MYCAVTLSLSCSLGRLLPRVLFRGAVSKSRVWSMWTIPHTLNACCTVWMRSGNGSLMVINGHVPYNISIYACNHIAKPIQSVTLRATYTDLLCVNAYTTYIDVHTEHAFMLRAHNKSRTFNWSHIELMYIFTLRYFHFRQPHDVVFSCSRSLSRSLYLWAIHPTIVHIFHYDYVLRLVQTVTDEPINYFFRNSIDDISTHYTHSMHTR